MGGSRPHHLDRWAQSASLYLGLAFARFCPLDDVVFLRKLRSPYQGHPHWLTLPGVEVSTGSLGQGLSIAVGIALAGKLSGKSYTTFCIMGDGEQQEGQIGKLPWKPAIINWTTWWESSIATGCRSMAQLLT